jgi:hypothetical protein
VTGEVEASAFAVAIGLAGAAVAAVPVATAVVSAAGLAVGVAIATGDPAAELAGAGTTCVTGPDLVISGDAPGVASCPNAPGHAIPASTANAQNRRIFPPVRFIRKADVALPCANLQLDATTLPEVC